MKGKASVKSRFSGWFWRVLISVVGAALIIMAVLGISLYFFGTSAPVNITTRRVGGASEGHSADQRYLWSLDYTFQDAGGTLRSGHTTRRGSDYKVALDNRVYYFTWAPFLNQLEREVRPNLTQPVYLLLGIFLLFVMNRKGGKP